MKIAMIGQKGIPARSGGVDRHVEELSAELVKHGHEVLVFCRPWHTWPVHDRRGIRCIATPCIRTKHLDTISHTLTSILRAAWENADVFHFHGVGPALLAWLPRLLRPSAKVVVTFHSMDRAHQKWGWISRRMLQFGEWMACRIPDATITVSRALSRYCRDAYGKESIYIPNGTHLPLTHVNLKPLDAFGLKPNEYLLMCSRLIKVKGAHTLIEAWKKLRVSRSALVAPKKLVMVGDGSLSDRYVQKLQRLASPDSSILFTGLQTGKTLEALFAGSYAMIHPSELEGLSIAVLEAMSYGKCVLASNIPENAELMETQGLQFRVGNAEDLAGNIAMMLEQPELVQAVGREARDFVAQRYDWNDIGEQTAFLYESLSFIPHLKEARS